MNVLDFALDYRAQHIACLPFAPGSKEPEPGFYLRVYQWTPQTQREVEALFAGRDGVNIALLGGQPSDGAFFVDADNAQKFSEFERLLDGMGIETWVMQRDRFALGDPHAGGGHFYLKAPLAVASKEKNGWEIRGQGEVVVAPPSVTTAVYRFIRKPPTIFRLPTLDAIPNLPLEQATEKHERKIPRLAWRLLKGDEETIMKYPTRSEAECALCASLIRAGYGFDEVLALFMSHPGPGKFGELYADSRKNGTRYLYLTFQRALDFTRTHATEAEALAHRLMTWALSRPWPGQTGATDKAVYMAHLQIVLRCGHDPHGASCREIAELAGVNFMTAAAANRRLMKAGLLDLVTPATPSLSHVWRLRLLPDVQTCNLNTLNHPDVMECIKVALAHDACRFRGLGKSGAEVLAVLVGAGEPIPEARIVEATGRDVRTVRRKLDGLLRCGLVLAWGGGKWQAVGEPDLDTAAIILGTAGVGKRQCEQHLQDRRLQRLVLKRGQGDKK